MAALVQTYPAQQSSAPVSLMQPRSQSSSGAHHHNNSGNSAAAHHPHNNNSTRSYRDAVAGNSAYRGSYNSAPVATYAFTSTPGLSKSKPTNTQQSKADKSPVVVGRPEDSRHGYTSLEAISSDQSVRPPLSQSSPSRSVDDLATTRQATRPSLRPLSTASLQPPGAGLASPARPSPDRYRKVTRRTDSSQSVQPSGSGIPAGTAVYTNSGQSNSNPSLPQGQPQHGVYQAPFIGDYAGQLRSQSVDDIHTHTSISGTQQSLHSRRRSVGPASLATTENFQNFLRQEMAANQNKAAAARPASPAQPKHGEELKAPHRPGSRRTGSTDSSASGASSRNSSISNRNSVASGSSNPSHAPSNTPTHELNPANIPPRGSSSDAVKRVTAPSPLSKPVNLAQDAPKPATSSGAQAPPSRSGSAAEHHLAVLEDNNKKGMKNRLRRAFSFGSAAELRKASAVNSLRGEEGAERARLRQDKFREQQDAEQQRIAQNQEASGLGENIYSGQGNFFTGSTDNISVSSTASSASIMIRKMGKGVKRTSRSLAGLFRPKSITGVAPASGPVNSNTGATGQVSMITVEAEREKVNVNVHPSEGDGGTDFPKLERNSIDAGSREYRRGSIGTDSINARLSFIGGERERAEVLASMKKGILKRSGSASPIIKAQDKDALPASFQLPEIPHVAGENQLPGATGDAARDEDYFATPPKLRLTMTSNSAPASPNSMSRYNVSFSPRITFHDTWPSGEYDRRGEVSTCNRLTPMLAQQIKEELNTFKMEMDVHEESKVYTHFF